MTLSNPRGSRGVSEIDETPPPSTGGVTVLPDQTRHNNAATAASAAGVRALIARSIQFYFRAPVKAFFRTRVDYLTYARGVQQQHQQQQQLLRQATQSASTTKTTTSSSGPFNKALSWLHAHLRSTTPGVLASAVRHSGWRVVPDQVLPPLVANVAVGAVLYTSYLQILGRLHPDSARASKRVYPPPSPVDTAAAGFLAGSVQSVVAAPLDAIQARYDVRDVLAAGNGGGNGNGNGNGNGTAARPRSMWAFSAAKLREIGLRGIFAGWGLSFLKDSIGSAVFFSTFEYVKAQGFYSFVQWHYGSLDEDAVTELARKQRDDPRYGDVGVFAPTESGRRIPPPLATIRPHYGLEPAFLMLAGITASVAQQVILHPLTHIQVEHWDHLEHLDAQARALRSQPREGAVARWRWRMFRAYYHAYQQTWAQCRAEAAAAGIGLPRWLFRGFWWNTVRQVPSTSAGLVIFELVRRKYGFGGDQVRIEMGGYDILLD